MEVVREVPVDRLVEVIREIPVEIIKEVEVPVEVPFKYYVDEKGQVYDEDGNVLEGKTLERKLEEIQKRVLKYQK